MNALVLLILALVAFSLVVWIAEKFPWWPASSPWVRSVVLMAIGLLFLIWLLGESGLIDLGWRPHRYVRW